jgi:large subunit ribosomal protein L3
MASVGAIVLRHASRKSEAVPSKAIVGEKVGMTQVWDAENRAVAVTVIKVTPARVVQLKTPDHDGYSAVQVTYGSRSARSINKPLAGHYAKAEVDPGRALVELRVDDTSSYAVGQELSVDLLAAGDKVDVTAVSKGKGFAGGMKRHNFKGQGASHGNHKHHRAPGGIGACATPARVFKGTRMAGQMGNEKVTTWWRTARWGSIPKWVASRLTVPVALPSVLRMSTSRLIACLP